MNPIETVRQLPAVEVLARRCDGLAPAPVVRAEARGVIERARERLGSGRSTSAEELYDELNAALVARQPMRRVINATGVLLHTNLGRAQLTPTTGGFEGHGAVAIEIDLGEGVRGRRLGALEDDICELTGAAAALVVNNNAGALLLVLSALAHGGEVIVSRGQLVEIGGSFRIPDIVTQGGAILREVGTTNRTRVDDLRDAIGDETRVILEVHPSNFAQIGFTRTVATADAATLARDHGIVMVHDIGSGLVDARTPWLADGPPAWLRAEPAARQVLEAGAHVVTFSGDKLLGGPQGGIVCGDVDLLAAMRRHPLYRALRYDKLRAAHLHAVIRAHLDRTAGDTVPFWRMASAPIEELEARAAALVDALAPVASAHADMGSPLTIEMLEVDDTAGAGASAGMPIAGFGVAVGGHVSPDTLASTLRREPIPVVARVRDDQLLISMRSVDPADDAVVATSLSRALAVDRGPVGDARGRRDR